MPENYIVINGKKAELTEEQLKALGIELEKENPFSRQYDGQTYYCINECGRIDDFEDFHARYDDRVFAHANYCTDKKIMEQRALHETLNRLLWRYSMEHNGDKIHLNHCWGIGYSKGVYEAFGLYGHIVGESVFYDKETAKTAIKEIINPFMKEHPDFKWEY